MRSLGKAFRVGFVVVSAFHRRAYLPSVYQERRAIRYCYKVRLQSNCVSVCLILIVLVKGRAAMNMQSHASTHHYLCPRNIMLNVVVLRPRAPNTIANAHCNLAVGKRFLLFVASSKRNDKIKASAGDPFLIVVDIGMQLALRLHLLYLHFSRTSGAY